MSQLALADNLKVNTPTGISNALYYRVKFSERSNKFVHLSFMFVICLTALNKISLSLNLVDFKNMSNLPGFLH